MTGLWLNGCGNIRADEIMARGHNGVPAALDALRVGSADVRASFPSLAASGGARRVGPAKISNIKKKIREVRRDGRKTPKLKREE